MQPPADDPYAALPYWWDTPIPGRMRVRDVAVVAGVFGTALILGAPLGGLLAPPMLIGARLVHRWHTRRPLREYATLNLDDPGTDFRVLDGRIVAAEHPEAPPLVRLIRDGRVGLASQRFLVVGADSALVVEAPHIHVFRCPSETGDLMPQERSFEVHVGTQVRLIYLHTRSRKVPEWAKPHLEHGYRDSTDRIDHTAETAIQPLYLEVDSLDAILE